MLMIFITFIYFSKKRINNEDNNIYSKLVIVSLIESFLMLFTNILVDFIYLEKYFIIFNILNKIIYSIYIVWMSLLFVYIYKIGEEKFNHIINYFVLILNLILICLIIIFDINLYFENGFTNSYGMSANVLYFGSSLYLILMSILVIKNYKKSNNKKKYYPFFVLFILMSIMLVIRVIDPLFNVSSNIFSFIILIMYFTIENPDIKIINSLKLANEEIKKANNSKSEFLSNMSHEVRTPLNVIVGFSECLEDAKSLDEAKEISKDIISASNVMLEIVNGILDISKIESGKLKITNSSYDAKEVFLEVAKLMEYKMKEKGLDYSYYIDSDLPDILIGDYHNIKKIITNLLSNAYKYTSFGFVKYSVNVVNEKDISKLIISVEDSGRGIKKEKIDKLFTKFERLDEDRNTTVEGTGLGLAITKQLVEAMGGKLIVQTIYGEGSKFSFIIDQKIDRKTKIIKKTKTISNIDLSLNKILVVDDNLLNLKVMKKILENLKCKNIELVNSGYEAIEVVKYKKFDIILLDIMMPKLDGVNTLKQLKLIKDFNTPVIAMTANALTGMKEAYLNNGFNDYISKPIEKNELINVLNNNISSCCEVLDNNNNNIDNKKTSNNIKYDIDYLKDNNIDVDKSLELLGDMEMYNMMINDFLEDIDNRMEKLKNYKDGLDMKNYQIEVHSLKSDSKYLGFKKLADISYDHELKSKDNNTNYINNNYNILELEVKRVIDIISKYNNYNKKEN